MKPPTEPARRKPTRHPGYDYAAPGAYFITSVTHGRIALLGRVLDEAVRLTDAGGAVERAWRALPVRFPSVRLDEFVVMPNHFHGIVWLGDPVGTDERPRHTPPTVDPHLVGAGLAPPAFGDRAEFEPSSGVPGTGGASPAPTLAAVISVFKSISAREVNAILGRTGQLWQRSYSERVVRNEDELNRIRQYILDNPARWAEDKNYIEA